MKRVINVLRRVLFTRPVKHVKDTVGQIKQDNSRPVYSSFTEALSSCFHEAYQNDQLVKIVIDKNIALRNKLEVDPTVDLSALRTLTAIGLVNPTGKLNVIDFGGGGGYHYSIANAAFGKSLELSWNVVETKAMSAEAQRLANRQLKFFDEIKDAVMALEQIDLIFTSGALQYCGNPLEALKQLTQIGARYIFITRTTFNELDDEVHSTQVSRLSDNGPGPLPIGYQDREIIYPITYASKARAEQILTENYDIQLRLREEIGGYSAGVQSFDLFGYFCKLKT